MEDIKRDGDGFVVLTSKRVYRTQTILLAIGRRGVPRKLGVPGEESPKVVYRLIEAEQYRNQHVLVVGGGDSALEAALDISAEPGTTVTLSYRGAAFNRVKIKNRKRLDDAIAEGRLKQMLESQVVNISDKHVRIRRGTEESDIAERRGDRLCRRRIAYAVPEENRRDGRRPPRRLGGMGRSTTTTVRARFAQPGASRKSFTTSI